MELKELAISDGSIEEIRFSLKEYVVVFRDWQETRWELSFKYVIGIENFNIEGDELDAVIEESDSPFIDRSRKLAQEPEVPMTCYSFRSPWSEEPLMRIVATGCEVKKIGDHQEVTT